MAEYPIWQKMMSHDVNSARSKDYNNTLILKLDYMGSQVANTSATWPH